VGIADAILALSPRNYWKLDEQSGGIFADYGSVPTPFTHLSGVVPGTLGPEVGTYALRLYASTLCTTDAFGLNFQTQGAASLMIWFTAPANGTPTAFAPCAGWGDPNNPTLRGLHFDQRSTANLSLEDVWNAPQGSAFVQTVPGYTPNWHVSAITETVSPVRVTHYIDNVKTDRPGSFLGGINQPTVPWWLRSASPVIIAHLALWFRELTQTEVQTVTSLIAQWPNGNPINGAPPSGGGGGAIDPTDPVIVNINTDLSDIRRAVIKDFRLGPWTPP